jgi:hypothetical protein
MKIKYFIFLMIGLLMHSKTQCQKWRPFNSKWIYNYSVGQGDSINFDVSIWCDSIDASDIDSIYFLNRITVQDENNYYRNQSHFLQEKVIFSNNNMTFRFMDPESYVIKPKSNVNDSWVFDTIDNIQAKVIQTAVKPIFGENDSVKVILLSTNDTIIISKSYGIIQFPNFGNKGNFHLIGIDNLRLGSTVPKLNDFINYSTDDLFEFKLFTSTKGTNPRDHIEDWQHYRYKITRTKKENDTLVLWRSGNGYHFQSNLYSPLGLPTSYGPDFYINDSIVIDLSSYAFLNGYNHDLINTTSDLFTYLDISYSDEFKEFQKYCTTSEPDIISKDTLIYSVFGEHHYQTFVSKAGLVDDHLTIIHGDFSSASYNLKLIACQKKDYSYGVFSNDTLFSNTNQTLQKTEINVYPNPSNDIIYLDLTTSNPVYVKIYDQMGMCIFDQRFDSKQIEIDIKNYKPGLYFINCEFNRNNFRTKFIKN